MVPAIIVRASFPEVRASACSSSRIRGDNKLIGGRHGQPTFDVFIRYASPLGQQFIQAFGLCLKNGFGVEFEQFPRFRAGNKTRGADPA